MESPFVYVKSKYNVSTGSIGGPVAIGGLGGSGTRVVAAILSEFGFYLGGGLNQALDNVVFTLLFKRRELWPLEENTVQLERCIRIFLDNLYFNKPLGVEDYNYIQKLAAQERAYVNTDWLHRGKDQLCESSVRHFQPKLWGWKEPNTHIFVPALVERLPAMRYIHVVRNGLDMAFSSNQTQLRIWGPLLTGKSLEHADPSESFRYWCAAHERILTIGKTMGEQFLLLDFDKLCTDSEQGINTLVRFLGIDVPQELLGKVQELIRPPSSIGRYKGERISFATQDDHAFLKKLGYEC